MTRKERMAMTIRHREPDRVPKGEVWIDGSLANRLLGTTYPLEYQHYERDRNVRMLLNMDYINLGDWPSEELGQDASGNKVFRSNYGYTYITTGKSRHIIEPPLRDIADADRYPVPDIRKVSGEIIADFARTTDFYIFAQIGGPVSMLDEMFPMEDYLVYCLTNTREMRIIGEKVMSYEVAKAKLFLDNGADAVLIADDIAFNNGTFLPPAIMEQILFPLHRQAVQEIKKHRDVPVFFHSDGDLHKVLARIVDSGFDGIHSLQPSAGMDIEQVKRDFGRDLCLMGNIDLDHVLTFASPDEVEAVVKRTIEAAAPGGGYILSSCNSLVDAIPPENAIAMYRAGDKYGKYG